VTLLALVSLGALLVRQGAFSALPGQTRKQQKASTSIRQRSNFKETLEVALPEEEEEPPAREPLPERRVPYSMQIDAHFPHHKHLKDESRARRIIKEKVTESFHNVEDIIQNVHVSLQISETFHKHTESNVKRSSTGDDDDVPNGPGPAVLAPYMFKCTVLLKTKKTVVLGSPEKHAQPTLTEGLDHMVDVVKRQLRQEKEKIIESKRKMKDFEIMQGDDASFEEDLEMMEAERLAEEAEALANEKTLRMYEKIESSAA